MLVSQTFRPVNSSFQLIFFESLITEVVALIMRYVNKYRLPKMKPSFTSMPTRKECTLYAFTKHSINSTTIIYK